MKAAIMGYGTIGSGVAKVLSDNAAIISRRAGEPIELKYVLDLRDFSGDPIQPLIVHDYKKIVYDPEIKLVVETMGGVEPAYTFVKAMLTHGKHVATSNKALVAAKGAELIQIAADNHVNFMFEASVGGGIPIIRPILKCTTGDVLGLRREGPDGGCRRLRRLPEDCDSHFPCGRPPGRLRRHSDRGHIEDYPGGHEVCGRRRKEDQAHCHDGRMR